MGPQVSPYGPNFPPVPVPPTLAELLSDAVPLPVGTAAAGGSQRASRGDHVHAHGNQLGGTLHADVTALAAGFMSPGMLAQLNAAVQLSDAAPEPIGAAVPGVGGLSSRFDHVHAHGNQLGGTLHALATALDAGFMSAAQVTQLAQALASATQTKEVTTPWLWASQFNGYRVRNVAGGATFTSSFPVPIDFGSLVSLGIIMIPNSTQAARSATFALEWGPEGASILTHTGGTTTILDLTGGFNTYIDATAAVTSPLVAGGAGSISLTNVNASTMSVIWTRMRYTPL